jgi:signal transduction histidine kinase
MKLAAKLVLVFLVGIVVLTGVNIFLALRHEEQEFDDETTAEARRLATTMEEVLTLVWRDQGQAGAIQLIQKASEREPHLHVRWVYFDASPGDPHCPAAPPEQVRAILEGRLRPVRSRGPDGALYAHAYWPMAVQRDRRGGLEFSKSADDLQRNKWDAIYRNVIIATSTAAAMGLLVTLAGVVMVGRPVRRLIEKTRRIGAGDLSEPVHIKTHDELGELARSINDMCSQLSESQQQLQEETAARIAASQQLRHADRLRTVGRLASGIAHEMGTPLNVVAGRADLIASGRLGEEEVKTSAQTIKAETARMTTIIRQLMDFARRTTPHRSPIDLRRVVRESTDLLAGLAQKQQVRLSVAPADVPMVASADAGQIRQVLTNLIVNAVQAMPDGGQIEIGLSRGRMTPPERDDATEGDYVCLSVSDDGPGIEPEHLDQIFEPFFTTKDVGEGTGLGLSIAHGIVQEHDGWIDVTSTPGESTRFTVYLPWESDK